MTPSQYAALLLRSLEADSRPIPKDHRSADRLWRESGAMWLSGTADASPRHCTAPVASAMQGAWLALCALAPATLDASFDAHFLLGERAAISGLQRAGQVSAGGAAHLLAAVDGWIVLNLARQDDWTLLQAWLETRVDNLEQLRAAVETRASQMLVSRGRLMGLAVAILPKLLPDVPFDRWLKRRRLSVPEETGQRKPLVVDLSSLWAGPLCSQMLQACGARVIRVESLRRPDGARRGPAAFHNLLNAGKESVALALDTKEGRRGLSALLTQGDIVIEGSRPRALEQMGIDAATMVAQGSSKVWLSITGYGRETPYRDWVAFGDDAGVASGLANAVGSPPVFCADAVADPHTGMHGAVAALQSWQAGGGELLDVSLFAVAQSVAALADKQHDRPTNDGLTESTISGDASEIAPPRARAVVTEAAPLGEHTAAVFAEFCECEQDDFAVATTCIC